MKNSTTKNPNTLQDPFQSQLNTLKMLITGSKMAKYSFIILIGFSFFMMANAEKTILVIGSLCLGIVALVFYIFKFLPLENMDQKSDTPMFMTASISKFKTYMANRKKNEIYFTLIWALSLIPFLSAHFESSASALIAITLFMTIVALFGKLGFNKTDKTLKTLENQMQMEI